MIQAVNLRLPISCWLQSGEDQASPFHVLLRIILTSQSLTSTSTTVYSHRDLFFFLNTNKTRHRDCPDRSNPLSDQPPSGPAMSLNKSTYPNHPHRTQTPKFNPQQPSYLDVCNGGYELAAKSLLDPGVQ